MNNSASVPSSRGLGRGPLKAKTRVRLPLGPPTKNKKLSFIEGFLFFMMKSGRRTRREGLTASASETEVSRSATPMRLSAAE